MNNSRWDYPQPFVLDFTVASEHIDVLQHLNNTVYVEWCQRAGWEHSKALGLGIEHYRELNAAMAIRHADYDYISAAYLGDELELGTWLTHCDNRLQLERSFQLRHKTTGNTLLRGRWQLVCISLSNGKAKRMPAVFRDIYGGAVITASEERDLG
ncbi:acyl-CoA thioester hydrolase [Litorivivens lipolytica]|uniref:Acyl-CoA thioester hydrolase n=1 Tax=Litorivivens lipolytica TaxID=1524264 RepID=A0A7W4Z470_9GAMM|nr:thioesterase family protein [Litorivivens lipolytica]MBB3045798.1 acyl-CoA thioester hydrolase [Litorivivens lipolytica]